MELSGEVSDYMQQNIAASQLTAYYKPTDLPHQLEVDPGQDELEVRVGNWANHFHAVLGANLVQHLRRDLARSL